MPCRKQIHPSVASEIRSHLLVLSYLKRLLNPRVETDAIIKNQTQCSLASVPAGTNF